MAAAAPLHAEIINFESLAPQALHYGQAIGVGGGYTVRGDTAFSDSLPTDLVGGILDGKSGGCSWLHCPSNNSGNYLAGLNDGVVVFERQDQAAFSIASLSASFVGPLAGAIYPELAGILRMQGFRADNSWAVFDIALPGFGKELSFQDYSTGLFGGQQFVALAMFAFACDAEGYCHAFDSNEGQFAVDNVDLQVAALPEPASWMVLGAGLLGLAACRRRRFPNAA
ncbi:NF038120 family PEP-CTERM protein [Massilia niastensis]|uniref:NF038120 family PEP-CTERM protein n=1 Tax=Massilia niastensis TaxID=544911 RepID=UPI00146E5EC5|nr:NF038120 family PEP-CTERM protein [Massilia niastensis]